MTKIHKPLLKRRFDVLYRLVGLLVHISSKCVSIQSMDQIFITHPQRHHTMRAEEIVSDVEQRIEEYPNESITANVAVIHIMDNFSKRS